MVPAFEKDRFEPSRETARSIGKLLFGAVATVFVLALVTLLPGIDRLLPGTDVSVEALARAIAGLVVAGVLVYTASGLATLVATRVRGELTANAASIGYWLVVLAAVLITHWGLSPLFAGLFGGLLWIYDMAFLLAALGSLLAISVRLYASLDPAADLFAEKVSGGGS
ncbi:hypothetical protein [Halapricum hydrolyticum]|uniref:Uncharacterized protein n=1 Tax=Halapricum hydrolyticum TaxID=2979991 RepID=A0AAE3IBV1_9EURY|nr:hypothetical protein [Halapricum hydrolyticum]MCU4718285.1 hypothetical protein [Halapricum hydrolyticum]MCU4727267.1 hypothetical protein [Halapricum hydrolyticum]